MVLAQRDRTSCQWFPYQFNCDGWRLLPLTMTSSDVCLLDMKSQFFTDCLNTDGKKNFLTFAFDWGGNHRLAAGPRILRKGCTDIYIYMLLHCAQKYRRLVDINCGLVWHYVYMSLSGGLLMRMRMYVCIYTCVCFCTFVYMLLMFGCGVGKRVGGTTFDSASSTGQPLYIYTSLNIMSLIVFYRYIM